MTNCITMELHDILVDIRGALVKIRIREIRICGRRWLVYIRIVE
mgnify:CR=1 FL=1